MYALLNHLEEYQITRNDLRPTHRHTDSDLKNKVGIEFKGLTWPDQGSKVFVVYKIVNEKKFTFACIEKGISPILVERDPDKEYGNLNQALNLIWNELKGNFPI